MGELVFVLEQRGDMYLSISYLGVGIQATIEKNGTTRTMVSDIAKQGYLYRLAIEEYANIPNPFLSH